MKKVIIINFSALVIIVLFFLFPSISYSFECCVTDDISWDEDTGDGDYREQPCPNLQDPTVNPPYIGMECWLIHRTYERTLVCEQQCVYIYEEPYCRPQCLDRPVNMIEFGCGVPVTTKWEEWDLNDRRNPIRGCYINLCFCFEDMCNGIARKQLAIDDCDGIPG